MSPKHKGGGSFRSKLVPNLDHDITKGLNLIVLQRLDPSVEEILLTTSHVSLYKFNMELQQWSRKDVEGSLFVVKRKTQPRFQFVVMNRRNTDNLVEDLLESFGYEVQVPYLFYWNEAQEVNGIWFYSSSECEAIADLFSRILRVLSKTVQNTKPSSFTVRSELEEREDVPNLNIMEGDIGSPTSSATAYLDDVLDGSFSTYSALSSGSTSTSGITSLVQASMYTQTSIPLSISSSLLSQTPPVDITEPGNSVIVQHPVNLLKPSFFSRPSSSSLMIPAVAPSSIIPSAPPLQKPVTLQCSYDTPLLQPFLPSNPSPFLSPDTAPIVTKNRVRDALLRLAQNGQFIDMVYREIFNAHHSS